jgi:uncharacterized protein YqgC (DUF456 family)
MVLLLAAALLAMLLLIPLGLPGTWLMVVVAALYGLLTHHELGAFTIIGTGVLALIAEGFEFALTGRFARRYGGSRRAGWGAMLGGMVGAVVGVPVPIAGPMLGAFAGSFAGALLFEYTRGVGAGSATRVAWGALLGRVAAIAMKVAVGLVMAAWMVVAALNA